IPVIGLIAIGDFSAALLVFLAAAATDAVDGPLARRLGGPTALGAALDPLADKVLVVGTLVALASLGIAPAWAVVLILARELVAAAASCTGGLLAAVLTAHGGSSGYFRGGAVVYSNEAKTIFAEVPPDLIH